MCLCRPNLGIVCLYHLEKKIRCSDTKCGRLMPTPRNGEVIAHVILLTNTLRDHTMACEHAAKAVIWEINKMEQQFIEAL